jgi:nucleotide-binding universal stress UspA family protein
MLDNILIPLDGSPVSEVALPFAEALARRAGARLILVRATHAPAFHGESEHEQFNRVDAAQAYLDDIVGALTARGVANIETGVPYGGDAAGWIVEEAVLRHADLIVMSTHDRSGTDRWLHGSVAEAVVHHAPVPVLLVRADAGVAGAALLAMKERNIIVPLDGSALAEAAIPAAVALARAVRGRLILVCVVPEAGDRVIGAAGMGVYVGDDRAQRVADERDYLDRMQSQLAAEAVQVKTLVIRGQAATEIAAAARMYAATAVVMATHGHTGVSRTIVGSVAGQVLHACNCPVMLIRPAELPRTMVASSGPVRM